MTPAQKKPKERRRGQTPMMSQYLELKAEAGDAILFYRMGDFYEMFFEDAVTAARICDLTLTSRNKSDPEPVPMAGVPWHSAEPHLARLLRAGHRVAVCEQVERPDGGGLMDRRIVEILTPGTALSEGMLAEERNNYIVAVCPQKERAGLAIADISTGEFSLGELAINDLIAELERLSPRELLYPREEERHPALSAYREMHAESFPASLDAWHFSASRGRKILEEQWGVVSLEPFGVAELDLGLAAGGALIEYARDQRRAPLTHLRAPRALRAGDALLLDEATLRNLEVLEPLSGGGRHCLLKVLDRTRTAMGARRLRRALARPLIDPARIAARHDAVERLCEDPATLAGMRTGLRGIADLERILGRLHCGRAKARDLARLRDSLKPIEDLIALAKKLGAEGHFPGATGLDPAEDLQDELARALCDDPTLHPDGEILRDGYDARLDELRELARGGRAWIAELQAREREETGIGSLKVGFNKVFGYYIEVTRTHLERIPEHYERKQTLVGGERFITPELKEWEAKVIEAQEGSRQRQQELIETLKALIIAETERIHRIATAVARWDLLASFAECAREGRYVRPTIDAGDRILIRDGRHPVVERFLEKGGFVPNDVDLDASANQIQIITGPNMAGKSTYLRQLGLLILMAQAGSFIPAKEARIGFADRIFTRVGASDQIARGQSTFLVEMIETSRILHEATSRSVVLLDEIGRGTSTFDGLAIAWAVAEHLRARPLRRPRTLFATHFHELTELARRRGGYQNLNVLVKEWKDQIIFVRRVVPGSADRSYGIQVARLAGLPEVVLARAREVLNQLEAQGPRNLLLRGGHDDSAQIALFAGERIAETEESYVAAPSASDEAILNELREIDLDQLSPRDALARIYDWSKRVSEGDPGAAPETR